MYITRKDLTYDKQTQELVNLNNGDRYSGLGFSKVYYHDTQWTKNYSKEQLKKFTDRGCSLDKYVEKFFNNQPVKESTKDKIESLPKSFQPFLDRVEEVYGQEVFLHKEFQGLASVIGHSDMIAKLDRFPTELESLKFSSDTLNQYNPDRVLIDWKTKKNPKFRRSCLWGYAVQVSLYCCMAKSFYNQDIDVACVVIGFMDGTPCKTMWITKDMMSMYVDSFKDKLVSYLAI